MLNMRTGGVENIGIQVITALIADQCPLSLWNKVNFIAVRTVGMGMAYSMSDIHM